MAIAKYLKPNKKIYLAGQWGLLTKTRLVAVQCLQRCPVRHPGQQPSVVRTAHFPPLREPGEGSHGGDHHGQPEGGGQGE